MKTRSVAITIVMALVLATGTVLASGHGWYESKIYGTIEKVPEKGIGTWIVNGREVVVTEGTFIKEEYGKAAVGAYVEVKGSYDGKTFRAYKIEVKRGAWR